MRRPSSGLDQFLDTFAIHVGKGVKLNVAVPLALSFQKSVRIRHLRAPNDAELQAGLARNEGAHESRISCADCVPNHTPELIESLGAVWNCSANQAV